MLPVKTANMTLRLEMLIISRDAKLTMQYLAAFKLNRTCENEESTVSKNCDVTEPVSLKA